MSMITQTPKEKFIELEGLNEAIYALHSPGILKKNSNSPSPFFQIHPSHAPILAPTTYKFVSVSLLLVSYQES